MRVSDGPFSREVSDFAESVRPNAIPRALLHTTPGFFVKLRGREAKEWVNDLLARAAVVPQPSADEVIARSSSRMSASDEISRVLDTQPFYHTV